MEGAEKKTHVPATESRYGVLTPDRLPSWMPRTKKKKIVQINGYLVSDLPWIKHHTVHYDSN